MRLRSFILTALVMLILPGSASAEEIIYFANGTSMPIRSHEIKGEMIHVDLGSESFMAFPLRMVEKIEAAGKEVMLKPSFSGGANVMASGVPDPSGNYPVRGSHPGYHAQGKGPQIIRREDVNNARNGDTGVQVHNPAIGHSGQNRRGLGVAARTKEIGIPNPGNGDLLGTSKVGGRNVIGPDNRTGPDGKPLPAQPLVISPTAKTGKKKSG
jgi:hypothetical protein